MLMHRLGMVETDQDWIVQVEYSLFILLYFVRFDKMFTIL